MLKKSEKLPHKIPSDLVKALKASDKASAAWEEKITLLAKNEWICWIESAKLLPTREKRIRWGVESLEAGKRRPCCWPGCPHRKG